MPSGQISFIPSNSAFGYAPTTDPLADQTTHQFLGPIALQLLPLLPSNQTGAGFGLAVIYGGAVTIGNPVYYTTAATVLPADATAIATMLCVGIALATASSGVNNILIQGIYRDTVHYSFATIGAPVFVAVGGGLTQTAPTATDQVIQPIGFALDANTLLFNPTANYITHV